MSFAIGWDLKAFAQAKYREDSGRAGFSEIYDGNYSMIVTGGTGTGASVDTYTVNASNQITSVTWESGSTGYVQGDVLTFTQGSVTGTYTLLTADVSGGVLQNLTGKTISAAAIAGAINIAGTVTNDILADSASENFRGEDPQITGAFEGVMDQRAVLDLTGTDNEYVDVDFIAAINANMDASDDSRLYLHYHNANNTIPYAEPSTAPFQNGAVASEVAPLANANGDPLDTFIDSEYTKHYDTRLVHLTPDGTRLRYVGINFSKQAGDAVTVGRIIGGKLWTPDRQPSVGMQWQHKDTTLRNLSQPGAYSEYELGRRFRVLTVTFEYVSEEQTYEFHDIFSAIGQARPCFVIANTDALYRSSMYCRMTTDLPSVEDWIDQQEIGPVTFEELVLKEKG